MKTIARNLTILMCLTFAQMPALWAQSKSLSKSEMRAEMLSSLKDRNDLSKRDAAEDKKETRMEEARSRSDFNPRGDEKKNSKQREDKRSQALDGAGSSNGGNVVQSQSRTWFLDTARKATEVPYDPRETIAYQTLKKYLDKNPGYDIATILERSSGISQSITKKVFEALNRLQFLVITADIPPLNDVGLVTLNANINGKVKRLAVQDKQTSIVLVNHDLLLELIKADPEEESEVAPFFLHEALIRVYNDNPFAKPLQSTEKIGNIVNITFGKEPLVKSMSARSLATMLNRAEIPVSATALPNLRRIGLPLIQVLYPEVPMPKTYYVFLHKYGVMMEVAHSKSRAAIPSSGVNPQGQVNFENAQGSPEKFQGGVVMSQTPDKNLQTELLLEMENGQTYRATNQHSPGKSEEFSLWAPIEKSK